MLTTTTNLSSISTKQWNETQNRVQSFENIEKYNTQTLENFLERITVHKLINLTNSMFVDESH